MTSKSSSRTCSLSNSVFKSSKHTITHELLQKHPEETVRRHQSLGQSQKLGRVQMRPVKSTHPSDNEVNICDVVFQFPGYIYCIYIYKNFIWHFYLWFILPVSDSFKLQWVRGKVYRYSRTSEKAVFLNEPEWLLILLRKIREYMSEKPRIYASSLFRCYYHWKACR